MSSAAALLIVHSLPSPTAHPAHPTEDASPFTTADPTAHPTEDVPPFTTADPTAHPTEDAPPFTTADPTAHPTEDAPPFTTTDPTDSPIEDYLPPTTEPTTNAIGLSLLASVCQTNKSAVDVTIQCDTLNLPSCDECVKCASNQPDMSVDENIRRRLEEEIRVLTEQLEVITSNNEELTEQHLKLLDENNTWS